jgi:hypothetical protein
MAINTMIYLAVDKDGTEHIFEEQPARVHDDYWTNHPFGEKIELPTGTIEKLTGKTLTWEDGYRVYVGDHYDPTPNE